MPLEEVMILGKEGIQKTEVENDPVYLLSGTISMLAGVFNTLFDETEPIEAALKEAGCKIKRVDGFWPRDSYVSFGSAYYSIDFFERSPVAETLRSFSWFGNGGCVISGDHFLIVSSYHIPLNKREEAEQIIHKFFPGEIYFVQPYQEVSIAETDHIDQTIGCIPGAKLITVDKQHYKAAKTDFQAMNITGYEVVPIDTNKEAMLLGNNYLVIEEYEKTVISNSAATRVNQELRNLGIDVLETPRPLKFLPMAGGSVRCATNRLLNESLLGSITLYNRCGIEPLFFLED